MKKFIYLASICLASCFASCDDFLTVESPDQMYTDTFWRDATDVESALAAAYSQNYLMTYEGDMWSFPEIKWPVEAYREDIIKMGADAMNYPNWVELGTYTYTNGNSQFSDYWRCFYRGINYANQVILNTPNIPEDILNKANAEKLIAEGHFLRGYYHMMLLLNWERIILRDKIITSPEDPELLKERATREAAWNFIIDDFIAAQKLPESYDESNMGRATRNAANSYLGWAYLTRAYEEPAKKADHLRDAATAFNNVTGCELEDNRVKEGSFLSLFDGSNKNSKEIIFDIRFSMSNANGATYRTQMHRWIGASEVWGWDEIRPEDKLVAAFEKEKQANGNFDQRYYETMFFNDPYFHDADKNRVFGTFYNEFFNEGLEQGEVKELIKKGEIAAADLSDPTKFLHRDGDLVVYDNDGKITVEDKKVVYRIYQEVQVFRKLLPSTYEGIDMNYCAVNVPLMRYANILLMKAEVLNEQGFSEDAAKLIDEVRENHGKLGKMTDRDYDGVKEQIEHQRMLEFPLENLRWYDLRRWGKLEEALQDRAGFDKNKHSFYPTPQIEINANPLAAN